ncbi:MAG: cobalamin biosynthesis protein CobD [Nitrospirae bacterium]|nr:cobalamin biosynthesis protein CobD [Nitrospirota bacterium]
MSESAILTLAYMLDLAIGDPKWLPHPVRGIGWAITKLELFLRHLIQDKKKQARNEKIAGIVLVLIIISSTYSLFYAVTLIFFTSHFSLFNSYLSLLIFIYLVSTTLATHGLVKSAAVIIKTLKNNDTDSAREKLSQIVGRDTQNLDKDSILKATIESLAENASDGIIAPLFYFAIGGLPLAMTYKGINTMDSMIGYRNENYSNFGWAAARLDDIANYIPARITGLLIVISTLIIDCFRGFKYIVQNSSNRSNCSNCLNSLNDLNGLNAFKIMLRDGRKPLSPNSGVPEAAMAGALGICLGGPSSYGGIAVQKPYIGEERKNTEHKTQSIENLHLKLSERAITITKIASLLGVGIAITILYMRIVL